MIRIKDTLAFHGGKKEIIVQDEGYMLSTRTVQSYGIVDIKNTLDNLVNTSLESIGLNTDLVHILTNLYDKEQQLRGITQSIFYSNVQDYNKIDYSSRYSALIPIFLKYGFINEQYSNEETPIFNKEGSISVAEFINTLENVVNELATLLPTDNKFKDINLKDLTINVYSEEELENPIHWCELGYLLTVLFRLIRVDKDFRDEYTGYTLNWQEVYKHSLQGKEIPSVIKRSQSSIIDNKEVLTLDVDINKYLAQETISEYLTLIKRGTRYLPIIFYAPLIELENLSVLNDLDISPLDEVSRKDIVIFYYNYIARELNLNSK